MLRVPLNRGLVTLVDAEDAHLVLPYSWFANPWSGGFYAMRRHWLKGQGRSEPVLLHREILRPPEGFVVDHINGDGLDNRKANLRVATPEQNARNKRLDARNRSGFKGVHWDRRKAQWRAMISVEGRTKHLGYFDDPAKAHEAYMAEATRIFGEFARAA